MRRLGTTLQIGSAACLLGVLLVPAGAGQDAGPLSDAQKRARIDELYESYKAKFPDAPEMTVEMLVQRLGGAEPPVIVDVRGDEEREVSMIPGAISQEEFERDPDRFAGREVVSYCTIGYRSGRYAQKLISGGWDAYNLRGSILSWTHAGGELDQGGAPTRRLHVYGKTWNLAPEGYEAVW